MLKETTGAFDGVSNSRLTDYESDAVHTASSFLWEVFVTEKMESYQIENKYLLVISSSINYQSEHLEHEGNTGIHFRILSCLYDVF